MRILPSLLSLALTSPLAACAAADAADATADHDAVAEVTAAATTPMLACNLEYELLSPFTVSPVGSFSVPFSQVTAQGAAASDGHYQIFASVNPTPSTNLSFIVSIANVQTGKDTAYTVLPPPSVAGPFLFETGARISALSKAGVTYDHIRAYCSYFLP